MPLLRYYITGHGLGHASRACQVIGALVARQPTLRCEVVSDAASWFLADNLPPGVFTWDWIYEEFIDTNPELAAITLRRRRGRRHPGRHSQQLPA